MANFNLLVSYFNLKVTYFNLIVTYFKLTGKRCRAGPPLGKFHWMATSICRMNRRQTFKLTVPNSASLSCCWAYERRL